MQTLQLNVGSTWDLKQLDRINSLNIKHAAGGIQVTEVYGSTTFTPSARAYDRLPYRTDKETAEFVAKAKSYGIDVRWTINSSCLGPTGSLLFKECSQWVRILKGYGINKFVATIPLVVEIIKATNPEAEIIVSTISRITSVKEIDEYCDMGVSGFCWDVMENRNFRLLKRAVERAAHRGVFIEVIVNEFCTWMCTHRNVCYNLSSHSSGREEFDGYPFSRCIRLRDTQPWQWLSARFILPSWLRYYASIGVERFKITGRTCPTDEVIGFLEHYIAEKDPDNLLDLWHHINPLVDDKHNPAKELFIPTKGIHATNLLKEFAHLGQVCRYKSCQECGYCRQIYDTIMTTKW